MCGLCKWRFCFAKACVCAAFRHQIHLICTYIGVGLALRRMTRIKRVRGEAQSCPAKVPHPPQQRRPDLPLEASVARKSPRQNLAIAASLTCSTITRHLPTRGSHPQGSGCENGLVTPSAESNGANIRNSQLPTSGRPKRLLFAPRPKEQQRDSASHVCLDVVVCLLVTNQLLCLGHVCRTFRVALACAKRAREVMQQSRRGHLRRRTMLVQAQDYSSRSPPAALLRH